MLPLAMCRGLRFDLAVQRTSTITVEMGLVVHSQRHSVCIKCLPAKASPWSSKTGKRQELGPCHVDCRDRGVDQQAAFCFSLFASSTWPPPPPTEPVCFWISLLVPSRWADSLSSCSPTKRQRHARSEYNCFFSSTRAVRDQQQGKLTPL